MSYPIIPLVPNWDSTKSEQSNIIVTKYQPNTIEARSSRTKINTTNVTFSVSVNITKGTAVDTFLRERNGKAFRVENDTMLYSCTEWTIQALGEGVDLFSATFEQVRRFL
jgi:phage-related protein